ncbi:glycerophosphodiester phosphodiesterase [Chelativorans sp. SCAU2101]|uniref:Glycerophosphodiester phosphodiesterase n=1 Tax=Chelativorans petroleitrophicus TaxID=2975484 RepID=A0A9X3AYY3_9HYPH|nr:glycerophosphodiester phosphodiesterase [Chelativorans petroleitrophicus]MCT8988894.1 glycerophosphodiester phosphodiesterase [Chelativorans petroleitrophicus]
MSKPGFASFAERFRWPAHLRYPLVIGHRGASGHVRENTLEAFARASDLGAEMWELDAQVTRDGVCVVSHDDHLQRVFGVDARISELSWAELAQFPGVNVPTFAEVAALAQARSAGLYVEIKAPEAAPLVWRHLLERDQRFAVLGSFDTEPVRHLRRQGCDFPLSVLVRLGADTLAEADAAEADIVHLCWERGGERPQDLVTPDLMDRIFESGRQIVLWHEERPEIIADIVRLPVIGICSDLPERLRAAIDGVAA